MTKPAKQSVSGSVGGASNEVGSGHRAGVATHVVVAALTGGKVPELLSVAHEASLVGDADGIPNEISLESDDPTDDINVTLVDGSQILIQAKVTGTFATLSKVLSEQWIPSLVGDTSGRLVSLVLAVERMSYELVRLQEGWRRQQRTISSRPNEPERKVLAKWDSAVAGALLSIPASDRQALADRLSKSIVIADIRARAPRDNESQLQLERLRSIIPDRPADALGAITGEVLSLAQNRAGSTVSMWTQFLSSRGFEVLPDPRGRPASQMMAEVEGIKAYRSHLAESLNKVTVPDVKGPVLRLVVRGLASGIAVSYATDEDDRLFEHDLFPAVRSTRRSFVVGEGGSGKSESLRQLAAFAANPILARQIDESLAEIWPDLESSGPLPVLVDLKSLLPLDPAAPVVITYKTISNAAVRSVQTEFSISAAAVISRAMQSGTALILLDGLDECAARMSDVVAALGSFFNVLPRDSTVVLAGRPSSQADALRLGFSVLRLAGSKTLAVTRDAILRRMGENAAVENVRAWTAERVDWFNSETSQHSDLFKNPLMAILATVVAGHAASPEHLPRGRARLVKEVLDHYMENWESRLRHRGDLKIATLDAHAAVRAVKESFLVVAHHLDSSAQIPRAQVEAAVRDVLQARYISAPAVAESGAEQIVSAWLDSGILTETGSLLAPRLRLFAEAGEALYAASLPETLTEWVKERIDDPALHGHLVLAAELTPLVLEPALQAVEASLNDLNRLIIRATAAWAMIESPRLGSEDGVTRASAIDRLFDGLVTASRRAAAATTAHPIGRTAASPSDWPLWRSMEIMLEIGTSQRIVGFIDEIIAALSTERLRTLASALVKKTVLFHGPIYSSPSLAEVDENRETVLDSSLPLWEALVANGRTKAPTDPSRRDSIQTLFAAARYDFLVTLGANLLLPVRPDLAVVIVALTERMGGGEAAVIRRVIVREGYGGMLVNHEESLLAKMAVRQDQMRDVREDAWLESLSERMVSGQQPLTGAQQWHLDAIGQLVRLYSLNSLASAEHAWTFAAKSTEHRELDDIAMRLLGLDPRVVGAQAAQLIRPQVGSTGRSSRRLLTLLGSASDYRVDWTRSRSTEEDRATILSALTTGHPMFGYPACRLLLGHPDPRGTALLLEDGLPALYGWAQYVAALLACELGDDEVLLRCSASSLPASRAAAGSFLRDSTRHGEVREQLHRDTDRTVRVAVSHGETLDDGHQELPIQALCLHCGYINQVTSACVSCGLNIPDPS